MPFTDKEPITNLQQAIQAGSKFRVNYLLNNLSAEDKSAVLKIAFPFLEGEKAELAKTVIRKFLPNFTNNNGRPVSAELTENLNNLLIECAEEGNGAVVKALLHYGVDANHKKGEGYTAISAAHLAAKTGDVESCIALIEHGADFSQQNYLGYTPLEYLETKGMTEAFLTALLASPHIPHADEVLKAILDNPETEVLLKNYFLNIASNAELISHRERLSNLCIACIEKGVDIFEKNYLDYVPFEYLAAKGKAEDFLKLILNSPHQDKANRAIVALLDNEGTELLVKDYFLATIADDALISHTERLINLGVNIHYQNADRGRAAIHIAAVNGSLEMVKLLVEKGAALDSETVRGRIPLDFVGVNSNEDVRKFIVNNTFVYAAKHNKGELLQRAYEENADIYYADAQGESAFDYAVRYREIAGRLKDMVSAKRSASQGNLKDASAQLAEAIHTPLLPTFAKTSADKALLEAAKYSAQPGAYDKVKRAIKEGADVKHAKTAHGWTALHLVAAFGSRFHYEKYGNDAVEKGNISQKKIMKRLIESGADIKERIPGTNQTPLDLLHEFGQYDKNSPVQKEKFQTMERLLTPKAAKSVNSSHLEKLEQGQKTHTRINQAETGFMQVK